MKYTVKNFKIFDEKGVTFDIAPITMLTGCNSSGKSSLVKSMMVLGEYLKKVKSYLNTVSREDKLAALAQPLDFAAGVKDTGGFDNVLNEHNMNGLITFQYTVDSKLLMEEVTVTLSFEKDPNDTLGRNGKLHEVVFQRADGTVFYNAGHDLCFEYFHSNIDMTVIKDTFMDVALKSILINFEDRISEAEETLHDPQCFTIMSMSNTDYAKEQALLDEYTSRLKHIKESLPVDFDYHDCAIPEETKKIFKKILVHQTFGDDDIIALYKYKTVLYLPWLKILDGIKKEDVRKVVKDSINGIELSEELIVDLDYCLDSFDNSDSKSFYEYYMSIENNICHYKSKLDFRDTSGDVSLAYLFGGYKGKNIELATSLGSGNHCFPHDLEEGDRNQINQSLMYLILANAYGKLDAVYAQDNISEALVDHRINIKNHIHKSMQDYMEALWDELLVEKVPDHISHLGYVGSNRAIAQRLYSFDKQDSELNQHIKTNIELQHVYDTVTAEWKKRALNSAKFHEKKTDEELEDYTKEIDQMLVGPKEFVGKWLRKFEICDAYSIDTVVADGVTIGCFISLEKNGKKHSIADEGYGCIQIFTVLLAIQNMAYKLFIDVLEHDKLEKSAFAVEEPENHLHPKLQSLLADMFQDASEKFGMTFIVETHSEYLIRKSQVLVKKWYEENKDTDKPCPFQAYYIPVNGVPYSLGYRKDGKFSESFGPGFYDESANLTFEIM